MMKTYLKSQNESRTLTSPNWQGCYQFIDNRNSIRKLNNTCAQKYNLLDRSKENINKLKLIDEALSSIDIILTNTNINYVLHGSMSQAKHGGLITQLPSDIDIAVSRLSDAFSELIKNPDFKDAGGSMVVKKIQYKGEVDIDVVDMEEFGLSNAKSEQIENINVLTLWEVIYGLILRLRHERRNKDMISLSSLIVNRGSELQPDQQTKLFNEMKIYFREEDGITDYQKLYNVLKQRLDTILNPNK